MTKQFIHIISGLGMLLISLFVIIDMILGANSSVDTLYYLFLIGVLLIYVFLLSKPSYRFGFHFIIITYTILCQFGYLFANKWNSNAAQIRSVASLAYQYMPEYVLALEISWLFIAILAFSVRFNNFRYIFKGESTRCVNNLMEDKNALEPEADGAFEKASFIVGMILLIIGLVLLLFTYIITRGMPYSERSPYLKSTYDWYGHVIVILSYAYIVILANCNKSKWKTALIPYAAVIIVHLLMGNRGEVLYTLITCLAVYNMKYKKVNLKLIIIGGTALVMLIPLVRDFRQELSLATYTSSLTSNLVETFSEIGFQIAPFTYTIQIVNLGTPYRLGATYIYGIVDFIFRKIPFVGALPTESINNIKYMMPKKGMGFSTVAESFYNFGIIGGGIFIFIIGILIFKLEMIYTKSGESKYKKTFAALFVVEMMNLTRNSSGTLMLYITYILLILLSIKLVTKFRTR